MTIKEWLDETEKEVLKELADVHRDIKKCIELCKEGKEK